MRLALSTAVLVLGLGSACTKTPTETPASGTAATPAAASEAPSASAAATPAAGDLVARGRVVYVGNCIACHNSDPKRPGALGPEVHGASEALLEARILRAEYPAGYTPKRATKTMLALPHLKADIPALVAFLNAP